ncbi:MAG: hypothetical protein AMXMBFR4_10050 [Candidatus Hydrogenedentota bacterium]
MGLFEMLDNASAVHAAIVHMPIALAVVGIPLVYLCAVTTAGGEALRWVAVACYALLALCGYVAYLTGEGAEARIPAGAPAELWKLENMHAQMGEWVWILGAFTAVILALSAARVRGVRPTMMAVAMVASLGTGGWVAYTAHLGGTLVYVYGAGTPAMDRYAAPAAMPEPITPAMPSEDPAEVDGLPSEPSAIEDDPPLPATPSTAFTPAIRPIDLDLARNVSYTKDIAPIMEQYCVECHNPDKARGDFDATSVLAMMDGGKKAGPGIKPGKPDESSVVRYIRGELQPQMPKGEDPMSEDQLHAIRLWIAAGAVDDSAAPLPGLAQATAEVTSSSSALLPDAQSTPARKEPEAEANAAQPSKDAKNDVTFNDLLFSGGPEELLILRRARRLELVPRPAPPPNTTAPFYNEVDRYISAKWAEVDPDFEGAVCDDETFARRVHLDVTGLIPTAEQVRAFVADPAPDKREKLVDSLLANNEAYAAHWTPFWEDALCSNGNHQGGVGTRGNYRNWIFKSFKENKPYDLMVMELLDPHMPEHPGRYVLRQDHTRILKSAADTAQVFLGTSMKCASCHNHFENPEWPQARFLGFAGYFTHEDLELIRCEAKTGKYIPTGFVFDLPDTPAGIPISEAARIARVAQLIIDPANPRFSKTLVNRLWKRYLGLGLFEPADDYRLDVPASHPELLEWLAFDFMSHNYDMKHAIRTILTSRTYQLEYRAELEDHYDVADKGLPRYFRSPKLRRLTAEQLLDSVQIALGGNVTDQNRAYRSDESTPLTRALGRPATRNEVSTARADDSAVVQSLELLNGPEYYARIYDAATVDSFARRIRNGEDSAPLIDEMYWAVLSRAPTPDECAAGVRFLEESRVDVSSTGLLDRVYVDDPADHPDATPDQPKPGVWVSAENGPVWSGTAALRIRHPAHTRLDATGEGSIPLEGNEVPAPAAAENQFAPAAYITSDFVTAQADSARPVEGADGRPRAESGPKSGASTGDDSAAPVLLEHRIGDLSIELRPDDVLYMYVFIEPTDAPRGFMLEWRLADSTEYRVYWGENVFAMGSPLENCHDLGPLPEPGNWVRLTVPASTIGLEKGRIQSITIKQADGTAYWDRAGVLRSPIGGPAAAAGDALWALVTSPEFQYVQ